jgi:hypothetical protein
LRGVEDIVMRLALVTIGSFLIGVFAIVAGAAAITGMSAGASRTATMPYEDCLEIIAEASRDMEPASLLLRDTASGRTLRIAAADGHVTVACRRDDRTITLTGTTKAARTLAENVL